ncbi:MAG: outer membrane beta-barrel protein [Panacagrimonas sp.]
MNRKTILAAAACAFALPTFAASAGNFVDGYYIPFAEVDVGSDDADGDGFGVKGAYEVGTSSVFFTGEYQSVDYDDIDADIDQLRLGAAFGPGAGSVGEGLYGRGEYVSIDFADEDQNGFGGHVGYGLPVTKEFRLYGEAGYLLLDDVDGPELLVGATYQFAPNLAAFGDFRNSFLDVDGGGDLDLSQFRIGARFLF